MALTVTMHPRFILFFSAIILVLSTNAQQANPFLKFRHDKILFCDFESNGEKRIILFDSVGNALQKITKQIQLNALTVKTLNTKLGSKASFGGVTAACFEPHCGSVYFNKGKVVAQVLVCLDCNRLQSSLDLPAQQQGKQGAGKEIYYIADGMSKSFRKYINQLLVANKFSHQIEPGSDFYK